MFPCITWLVWMLPIFSSIFIPLVAWLKGKAREYFAITVCAASTILAFSMVPEAYFNALEGYSLTVSWITALNINLGVYIDPLSIMLACLVSFFGLLVLIYSLGYMAGEEGLTRYYFFMLLFIGGMAGLVLSDNFLQLFIFWEIVGLCSFFLISFWYKRPETVRSAVKVFLMTRIGDICLLAGICILYLYTGSFSFNVISNSIGKVPLSMLAASAFLMLIGAVAKSAQLPFHTWLYSAMEAPTSVSALLHSATMVKAGVYLIARLICLFSSTLTLIPMWFPSIMWIGATTALIGGVLALSTTDIKGVAAYSTISQIGFMFAALGAAQSASSPGWFASILHLISHALFQALDFFLIGGIIHATKTRDMRLMGGLRKAMPITFALSLIVLLARAGIPPLISFFSKEFILQSVLSSGNLGAALILYASTALTFAYTLRVMGLVYMGEESEYLKQIHIHEPPKVMLFSSGALAALCITAILFGNTLSHIMHINVEVDLSEVLNFSTLFFVFTLIAGGLPVYLMYRQKEKLTWHVTHSNSFLSKMLEHGLYFDFLYEKVISQSILLLSFSTKYVEKIVFERLPIVFANWTIKLAQNVQKYLDTLIDQLLVIAVSRTLTLTSKVRGGAPRSIEHYVAAVLIGFLIILLLVIIAFH